MPRLIERAGKKYTHHKLRHSSIFNRGLFWPPDIVVACVCVCVSVCQSLACLRNNSGPVQARITKFAPKMQTHLLRSLLFCGVIDFDLQGQIYLESPNLPYFELVRTRTHHPFKLGSPNFDQRCKLTWLRSLSFWRPIDLDLQGQIWLKKWNFQVSPLLEIHNYHITTREPWVPRLLHRPDCFSLNTLYIYWSREPTVFRRLTSSLYKLK